MLSRAVYKKVARKRPVNHHVKVKRKTIKHHTLKGAEHTVFIFIGGTTYEVLKHVVTRLL